MSYRICCDVKDCEASVANQHPASLPPGWSWIDTTLSVEEAKRRFPDLSHGDGLVEELDGGGAVLSRKRFRSVRPAIPGGYHARLRYAVCPAHALPEPGPQADSDDLDGLSLLA